MIITVDRVKSDNDATLSIISVDKVFECFGLEDEYREAKVPKETRIPDGLYNIEVRTVGGFDNRYRKKFGFHRGMLHVVGVPGFDYILVHIGNTEKNTDGCLLVGAGANTVNELTIQSSKIAYSNLYKKVIESALAGNLKIQYVDNDL